MQMSTEASTNRTRAWTTYLLPVLAAVVPLAIAFGGAAIAGSGTNTVVDRALGISGGSTRWLNDLSASLALGFAFAAGLAASVNPCGFAMLPAYLALYVGSNPDDDSRTNIFARLGKVLQSNIFARLDQTLHANVFARLGKVLQSNVFARLGKALLVGCVVTLGFVALFGIAGIVIGSGVRQVRDLIPWIGLIIGVVLTLAGAWILGGGKIYTSLAQQASTKMGDPSQVGIKGYFLFGVSYGTASLSCTLSIFLAVLGISSAATDSIVNSVVSFVLFGLGMGTVVIILTIAVALFKGAMVGALRKILPYTQAVSAALMILAGSYIVFYWLTEGRDLL